MRRPIFTILLFAMMFVIKAQNCDTTFFPDGKQFYDTYHEVANDLKNWKHFNTHDPTVYKQGEWFYMYSTDASWGGANKTGALKRRSKDLVNWEFLGTAFDGIPKSASDFFINNGNPNYTDQGIWAPFLFKLKNKYILYYSAPGGLENVNFAYIGYATSDSISGPWEDQGMITTSFKSNINAIDPSVVFDSTTNKLWMAYGSWFSGIYILELDTATGGIKTPGDKGTLIANRKTSAQGQEGPELFYRNGWYYLFLTYDPLGDIYNVRVGRSRTPNGPYYDFNGINMAGFTDNVPMIHSPYKFKNHGGWQGTGHCGVFNDNGKCYMFNQGRPSVEPAMMVLHVREMFWIDDWPVLSPQRYAGVPNCLVTKDSLIGLWEYMPLIYHNTAASAFHSTSTSLELHENGSFNNDPANSWKFENDTLVLNWKNNTQIVKLLVFSGWDWENNRKTLLFSGIDSKGICVWGKKIEAALIDKYKVTEGYTYVIRNALSHLVLNVPNNEDNTGVIIRQAYDNDQASQMWKIKDAGFGYYYLLPQHSAKNMCLSINKGSATNGAAFVLSPIDGSDKQKFKVISNANGLYRITTMLSNNASCADAEGFSTQEGARIIQWTYLKGLNQQWRFERVDSIMQDTVSIDTFQTSIIRPELKNIDVYPNPSVDGTFSIDLSSLQNSMVDIAVYDINGKAVLKSKSNGNSEFNLKLFEPKGIYFLKVSSGNLQYSSKLIVQ